MSGLAKAIILCGVSGSGKSSFAKEHLRRTGEPAVICSATDLSRLDPLVAAYRRANPRLRAETPIVYARNGTSVAQRKCVLCGERGPTWHTKWRKTRAAENWEAEHERYCPVRNSVTSQCDTVTAVT